MPEPLKLYFESHISMDVTVQLRNKGVDVLRCEEVGITYAADPDHLEYATSQGRVVVTRDDDFLGLHRDWQEAGKRHAGIMYLQPDMQGKVGRLVTAILEYYEIIEGGAGNVEKDIYNQVIFIRS
jgi:hypothetical protein